VTAVAALLLLSTGFVLGWAAHALLVPPHE
jgi:hypothetical protein